MGSRRFAATITSASRDRLIVPVPFDPDQVWGAKPRHLVTGDVGGVRYRGVIERVDDGFGLVLRPAWVRDGRVSAGVEVDVELAPEGPLREDLAEDIAAALAANPRAAAFFDALAQFYRRAYLRWIDGTKRRPQVRAQRIAEMVSLLEAGEKQRPQN